jgi:hypothetical protein
LSFLKFFDIIFIENKEKRCLYMMNAFEANSIANRINEAEIQVNEIEELIKNAATNGDYCIVLHRGYERPLHPKAVKILQENFYTVEHYLDDYDRDVYRISWEEL